MSQGLGPYMIQTIGRRLTPEATTAPNLTVRPAVNDRTGHRWQDDKSMQINNESRQAAFNRWLSQISYMLDEWEMELIGQAAPLSTFETIAAFKDILRRDASI